MENSIGLIIINILYHRQKKFTTFYNIIEPLFRYLCNYWYSHPCLWWNQKIMILYIFGLKVFLFPNLFGDEVTKVFWKIIFHKNTLVLYSFSNGLKSSCFMLFLNSFYNGFTLLLRLACKITSKERR